MHVVRRGIVVTSRALSWVSGLMVIALMLIVVGNVVMRAFFSSSIAGSVEFTEVLLAFVVFAGVAYAQQSRSHVNTTLVTSRLSPRAARIVRTVGLLVVAAVLAWTVIATADRGIEAWRTGEARFGIREVPTWPGRLTVPIGLAILTLEVVLTALDAWRHRPDADDAAGVDEVA